MARLFYPIVFLLAINFKNPKPKLLPKLKFQYTKGCNDFGFDERSRFPVA